LVAPSSPLRLVAADPSGYGEGEKWLGWITVTTDGSGNASFDITSLPQTIPGQLITVTASALDGSTSEFSLTVLVQSTPQFLTTGVTNLVSAGTLRRERPSKGS
jgi:hypothetical protein